MKQAEAARTTLIGVLRLAVFVAAPLAGIGSVAAAAECPQPNSPIETDRPDVTNSPIVVLAGSLQSENGTDTSRDHGADILNGTNSRWRLGIAPCLEVLVDLPNYFATLRGVGPSGFGDVARPGCTASDSASRCAPRAADRRVTAPPDCSADWTAPSLHGTATVASGAASECQC